MITKDSFRIAILMKTVHLMQMIKAYLLETPILTIYFGCELIVSPIRLNIELPFFNALTMYDIMNFDRLFIFWWITGMRVTILSNTFRKKNWTPENPPHDVKISCLEGSGEPDLVYIEDAVRCKTKELLAFSYNFASKISTRVYQTSSIDYM